MKSNTRPWIVAAGLTGALLLISSFQNCAPMLPMEGVAQVNSSARATATPGPLATPNPGNGGYQQNVIDGVCSDNTTTDPMAVKYITAGAGSLFGFTNSSTNKAAFWKVANGNVIHGIVCSISGTGDDNYWKLAAIGDFNGDLNPDVLWRNTANGQVAVWIMNGANRSSTGILKSGTNAIVMASGEWNIEGVGYFDGTGRQGVVWKNSNGAITIWSMNGLNSPTATSIGTPPAGSKLAGLGDFNGNYRTDFLFRNGSSHTVWFTATNSVAVEAQQFVDSLPANFDIKVIGDFNGDSKADLLLVNTTGAMEVRYMSYLAQVTTALQISAPASGWNLQFAQDVTSDTVADWIWTIPGPSEPYLAYTPMAGAPGSTRTLGTIKTGWALFNYGHW